MWIASANMIVWNLIYFGLPRLLDARSFSLQFQFRFASAFEAHVPWHDWIGIGDVKKKSRAEVDIWRRCGSTKVSCEANLRCNSSRFYAGLAMTLAGARSRRAHKLSLPSGLGQADFVFLAWIFHVTPRTRSASPSNDYIAAFLLDSFSSEVTCMGALVCSGSCPCLNYWRESFLMSTTYFLYYTSSWPFGKSDKRIGFRANSSAADMSTASFKNSKFPGPTQLARYVYHSWVPWWTCYC